MFKAEEDYLETILFVQQRKGVVHSVDLARERGVSKPTVSHAMSVLREKGYVEFANDNSISLTEQGKKAAERTAMRHVLLTRFFMRIAGVPEGQAEENACRVEHDVDDDVVAGIERFMKSEPQ